MATSFLNIKKSFFPCGGVVFFVSLIVDKIIFISALLISLFFLSLQIVEISIFNIRKSISANLNLQPKALDFQGLFFLVVCNRLIKC